jgi:hypothetical protein
MILKEFDIQKSRKVYTCNVCSKDIKKGTDYGRHYSSGGIGHYSDTIYVHEKCYEKQLKKEVKYYFKRWGLVKA